MISDSLYNNVKHTYRKFNSIEVEHFYFEFKKEESILVLSRTPWLGEEDDKWLLRINPNTKMEIIELPNFSTFTAEELFQYSVVQEFNNSIFEIAEIQKLVYSGVDLSTSFSEYADISNK